jgi:Skp family chaperone for outer membrane proteins
MSHPSTWGRVLAATSILTCLAFALSASGQGKNGSTFAIVDFAKISAGYKEKLNVENELKALQVKYDAQLARRDGMPFASEEDLKTLDDLYEKANRTEAEQAKINDIEKKANGLRDEIQALRQKPDAQLNDGEKAKLTNAEKVFREAQVRFTTLKDNLTKQINSYGQTNSEKLMTKIKASIAKVAEQKGVAIVFNSEVALYAGTDITEPVISEVNKK